MQFRLEPQPGATHYATLFGIPCYFGDVGDGGCTLQGVNRLADWLLEWWPTFVDTSVAQLAILRNAIHGEIHESSGWPICVKGPIQR